MMQDEVTGDRVIFTIDSTLAKSPHSHKTKSQLLPLFILSKQIHHLPMNRKDWSDRKSKHTGLTSLECQWPGIEKKEATLFLCLEQGNKRKLRRWIDKCQ